MRFGISGMQFSRLISAATSGEAAMRYVAEFDHVESVRELVEHGFPSIELAGDLTLFFPEAYSPQSIERLIALSEQYHVSYTVHLPLWSVEPSSPLEPIRLGSVRALTEGIELTAPLKPDVYVLHATGALASEFTRMRLAGEVRPLVLQRFQDQASESMRAILAETGIPSRRLAVETVEFPFELTLALAEELDLSVCFDTGHILAGFSGPVDFFEALEQCLPRLAEIHLHDCPWHGRDGQLGLGKDHQPLGAGDLDVARLLDRLSSAGFTGPLTFELRLDQALASLDVIRSIRPDAVSI